MVLSVRNREETGRQERFEALYEEHFDALLAYALRRTERENRLRRGRRSVSDRLETARGRS
jgi:hypothetical protein